MISSVKRLILSLLLLASGMVATTVAGPPSQVAAATPTITVSPATAAKYAPGVQVMGLYFPPGATVYLARLSPDGNSYVAMGTAHVGTTGWLTGVFGFQASLLCDEVTLTSGSSHYLTVRARIYSYAGHIDAYAPGLVECNPGPS